MKNTVNKRHIAAQALAAAFALCCATAQAAHPTSLKEIHMVAPALEHYTQHLLLDEVWKRPGLSPRDRSIVTLSVLVARNQPAELPTYLNLALDKGVKQKQASEMLTQLAFYAGWPNVFSAMPVFKDVFAKRPGAASAK